MSMPPSGVQGQMDEAALIEAEIQLELENIDLDDEVLNDPDDVPDDNLESYGDIDIPGEMDDYVKRLQEQSSHFEQELAECDELLQTSESRSDPQCLAMIPYEDQTLLDRLAKEHGLDSEAYRKKILEDIANDEDIIGEELADLIGHEEDNIQTVDMETEYNKGGGDNRLSIEIGKAVEEGIPGQDDMPVAHQLVPVRGYRNGESNQVVPVRGDTNGFHPLQLQQLLRAELESVEKKYQERLDRIKKDEAFRRDEEDVRQRRTNEERQWKMDQIRQQGQQLQLEQEAVQLAMKKQQEEAEHEIQKQMRVFQVEIQKMEREAEQQRVELKVAMEIQKAKEAEKQHKAVVDIQRLFRGYRVRKMVGYQLKKRRVERRKEVEAARIMEVEAEIEERTRELEKKKEEEKQKLEEEAKKLEFLQQQREEEKRRAEEEKKKKKEEEAQLKEEEKKRKEEEKQRKKEEEKQKKEEEKRRKEEEKQKKEEKRKKAEEKRIREEEERKKIEEVKLKKEEEERMKKEQEKLKKEEEKKKQEQEQMNAEEEKRQKEEEKRRMDKKSDEEESIDSKIKLTGHFAEDKQTTNGSTHELHTIIGHGLENSGKQVNAEDIEISQQKVATNGVESLGRVPTRPKTPKSSTTPRTPRVSTPKLPLNTKDRILEEHHSEVPVPRVDALPEPLEALRLRFMKDCHPWSKVSNEPWKLKGGVTQKPLRRPSAAKKLPLLSEDVILQAAKVVSLKQVTTVELRDLPGNSLSPLGQCSGLKYLTLTQCNLVALDGLGQCKQLQYINCMENRIEYVDVRDLGQLQYVNLSHNRLSSLHGLDNCTNLRWLDVSYNNITRIGGMDSLRRLHTLLISHNQLISTSGLGATPTLQVIDMSHNHLPAIEDIDKLCLLLYLDVSSNNILQAAEFSNHVLLVELLLGDNSISMVNNLASVWLPLLLALRVQQNSLDSLPSFQNCLLLEDLDLSNNQLLDVANVKMGVKDCFYLQHLHLEDNPVTADIDDSFSQSLKAGCPRLIYGHNQSTERLKSPVKARSSFESMCVSQASTLQEQLTYLHDFLSVKNATGAKQSAQDICESCFKFCDRSFSVAVEFRYAHEYGDVTVTMPTTQSIPKAGQPMSSGNPEKFMNPKEMFENALKSSGGRTNGQKSNNNSNILSEFQNSVSDPKQMFESALNASARKIEASNNRNEPRKSEQVAGLNSYNTTTAGKSQFEQALRSADMSKVPVKSHVIIHNGHILERLEWAATRIQATWRGWHVRHQIQEHTKYWLAATTIQAHWRGYRTRRMLLERWSNPFAGLDPKILQRLNASAVKIQAYWRGFILRKKLMAALEFAQCSFEEEDADVMNLGDEFDLDKFMDIDQDLVDMEWKPPATPDVPNHYPVLKKPPLGNTRIPALPLGELRPPSNPRRAWRNSESPMSDTGKIHRPPSSVASTELTVRSGMSRKEEKLADEWGFKDSNTAHLMMQRAKKMKYNAERRKKIGKLDPKQRLALFRKLEEVTHPPTHTIPQRKTLPRKEYFQARQNEINRQQQERHQEVHVRASRTFEWLHTQVGDLPTSDSVINQGFSEGPKYLPTDHNFPELMSGKRVQLVSSPMSLELQSVDSASTAGKKQRRLSAGSGTGSSKLPPIQPSSAPVPHVKERMSFRNPKVNQDVGWGGGKKRAK
ncbi:leucine-rich repeat and IQ domain-containing protein 1-like [Dreissena polymorpha]|nr:leucine-rich repeat and IQ domain-containing protein 1-like [Dreissena polymorpha]XP_052230387.1 leucine-rich repeat and IQ domain-containing protein 1-like [Dreissena polymorpha]